MANVDQRLRTVYGEAAALQIESQWGEGTTVTITIPKNGPHPPTPLFQYWERGEQEDKTYLDSHTAILDFGREQLERSSQMTRQFSILVVDDELPARRELGRILKSHDACATCVEAANGRQALAYLSEYDCPIVFLDIQMPGQNGLVVAEQMMARRAPPLIIFATAYEQHAVKAFELNAIDYILKPYRPSRVHQALEKAIATLSKRDETERRLEELMRYLSHQRPSIKKIWAERTNGERLLVNFSEIGWAESRDKKIYIQLAQQELRVRSTLSELAGLLPPEQFIRVHRSFLVNLNLVREAVPWDSHTFTLVMGDAKQTQIPVGRKYAHQLRQISGW
jgi:DNA-binding LytR/AlgR family response regulator